MYVCVDIYTYIHTTKFVRDRILHDTFTINNDDDDDESASYDFFETLKRFP